MMAEVQLDHTATARRTNITNFKLILVPSDSTKEPEPEIFRFQKISKKSVVLLKKKQKFHPL